MKKTIFMLFVLTVFIFAGASEYYDKPFIFPGFHRKYFKDNIKDELLKLDFENYKPCAVRVLVDKDEVFPRALEMMKEAKKSVMFNMYLFGGELGENIVNILKEKIEQGVQVYMIMPEGKDSKENGEFDEFHERGYIGRPEARGGHDVKPPYKEKISYAIEQELPVVHAETKFLDTPGLVRIDHSKLIIIDSERALVGGMNFADTVAKNHDSMVEVVGPYVEEIEKIFINNWLCSYAKKRKGLSEFDLSKSENMMRDAVDRGWLKAEAIPTVTGPYKNNTRRVLKRLFGQAKNRIYVEQLLLNDSDIIKYLLKAAKRGVQIKVIVDPAAHLYSMDWKGGPNNKAIGAFQKLKKENKDLNAEIRHYDILPGQELHMKLCIVDGLYVGTGSTNFTSGAMRSNYEAFHIFKSRELAYAYENIFMHDWENRTVVPDDLSVVESVIGFVSDILF